MTSLVEQAVTCAAARMPYKKVLGLSGDELWRWTGQNGGRSREIDPRRLQYSPHCTVRTLPGSATCPERWEYEPRRGTTSDLVMLYFHGGAWIVGMSVLPARYADSLVHRTGGRLVAPRYPLFPDGSGTDYRQAIIGSYRQLLEEGVDPSRIVVHGDSAGGHAAMVLSQLILQEGLPQPARYLVTSPVLDMAQAYDARTRRIDETDPVISLNCIPTFGQHMADGLELDDPLVSPLFGDYGPTSPIDIFMGEREVLRVPALKLDQDWPGAVRVHLGLGCIHDWTTFPTPEGRASRTSMVDLMAGIGSTVPTGPGGRCPHVWVGMTTTPG